MEIVYDCVHIDGLVQERRNSSALAMELHISCTNPLISAAQGWTNDPVQKHGQDFVVNDLSIAIDFC